MSISCITPGCRSRKLITNVAINLTHQLLDEDYAAAGMLLQASERPLYDAVCFHAQQCAEKYLKAVLQENQKPILRTQHLAELLAIISQFEPGYQHLLPQLELLQDYAIDFRYPGVKADKEEAENAFEAVQTVRKFTRQQWGLSEI